MGKYNIANLAWLEEKRQFNRAIGGLLGTLRISQDFEAKALLLHKIIQAINLHLLESAKHLDEEKRLLPYLRDFGISSIADTIDEEHRMNIAEHIDLQRQLKEFASSRDELLRFSSDLEPQVKKV